MPSNLFELRPNRRLLDHGFEGYKLNLQSLPHYLCYLESPVDRVYPDEVQYSFIHAKLFALQNHLVADYWDYSFNYYYVDKKQQVRRITFDSTVQKFQNTVVYDVPAHVERKSGHFNLCLSFPSQNVGIVSDGTGYLHIIDTGNRSSTDKTHLWHTQHSSLVLDGKYFIIVDCRIQERNDKEILHCLLQSVEQSEQHFNSVITWVTFENHGQAWKQTGVRQLEGKGIVHFAAIETNCDALYLASDNAFKFTMDTENEITDAPKEDIMKKIYTWLQTTEDITVTLKLETEIDKKLLQVNITPLQIKVSYAGNTFIDGTFRYKVDSELTTWNIQETGQVDILMTKAESMIWDQFLEGGDKNGEQILDASLVEEAHKRLAHLCSETELAPDQPLTPFCGQELEECDAASEEDTVLVRIDATSHQVTHQAPLSIHQYLFNIKLETQEVPALALRHDVDACIWQPYALLVNSETWPVQHQGTLMAFGYVQSSKQNRKFITCPPNFSYSVVCEESRHIFIYQNATSVECQLRKKTGGVMKNIKVGQQHVFNVDKYGEVIGINATNEYLFILTENSLISLQIM